MEIHIPRPECIICREAYSRSRMPVTLNCGHSMCSVCLERIKRGNHASCPQDSKFHNIRHIRPNYDWISNIETGEEIMKQIIQQLGQELISAGREESLQRILAPLEKFKMTDALNKEIVEKIQARAAVFMNRLTKQKTSDEQVSRNVKITLNKITPTNVYKLRDQLVSIAFGSERNLELVVENIVNKASTELKYTRVYGELCEYIMALLQKDSEESKCNLSSKKRNCFRQLLIGKCQEDFEKEFEESSSDRQEQERRKVRIKKRKLGNIKFIGDLFNLRIIPITVIWLCIEELIYPLQGYKGKLNSEMISEEKLERGLVLVRTIGKRLEHSKTKHKLDLIVKVLEEMINEELVTKRMKFLIMVRIT